MKNALNSELFVQHFVDPVPDADGMIVIGCIDKNPPDDAGCEVLGGAGPYFQLPGGANYGGAIATAWEASKPGFLRENTRTMTTPLTTIGMLAAMAMTARGYRKIIHTPCLATTYQEDIAAAAADPTAEMLARAEQFDPTFTGNAQSRTIRAAGRVLGSVVHVTPKQAEEIMTSDQAHGDTHLPQLLMARLRDGHPARAILASYSQHRVFDVRGAVEAGNPAYCISMGLTSELPRVFPVQEAELRHALALTMGIISLHPKVRDADGDLLPIIRIDA